MKINIQKNEISSRIQTLCSDLRNFRTDFIQGAVVFGLCKSKNIPDEFKPQDQNLPVNIECRLRISFGIDKHKFNFSKLTGQESYKWTITNTGLENYTAMLCDIWPDGDYSWLVEKTDHVELLNKKANSIRKLSKSLLKEKEYRRIVHKVRELVRCNSGCWSERLSIDRSYPDEIEEIVTELETADSIKPAEAKPKAFKIIVAISISLILIILFILSIHKIPIAWFTNHSNSIGIQASFIFLIPCLIFGIFVPKYRKWCWGTAGLAFLVLILSLLDGRSQ